MTWLEVPASYYYATLHFVVTPLVLVWLFRRHQHIYAPLRSSIVLATVAALVVYATWPLAPPRYATAGAAVDTSVEWPGNTGCSGSMWCAALLTAVAASPKPTAISRTLPG